MRSELMLYSALLCDLACSVIEGSHIAYSNSLMFMIQIITVGS